MFVIHEIVPKFAYMAPLVPVNAMHFRAWRKEAHSFEDLALLGGTTLNFTGSGEPERIPAARVSSNLFHMLGVRPQLGRSFLTEEDHPGRDRVVIVSSELWKRRFASDPRIIGRKIMLDGNSYQIIGVLPASFHFPKLSQLYAMAISQERPQLWKPFAVRDDELDDMGDFNFACIGRLRPGVSRAKALSELNVVQANLAKQTPEKVEFHAALVPLQDQITFRSRSGLELLLAAVAAVLLIACVNIANLLLTRATVRRREIAIRIAIGASGWRLLRQIMVESWALSSIGGFLGFAVAYIAIRIIVAHAPLDFPRMDEVHLNARVLIFTTGLAMLTGVLFGLFPALNSEKADAQEAMKSGSRGTTTAGRGGKLRSLLVGVEVGLSAMCLIVGGLLLHSFVKLLNVDKGFDAQHTITVNLNMPEHRYSDLEKRAAFLHSVLERVESLPGIISAGVSNMLPLSGEGGNNLLGLEGVKLPIMDRPLADIRQVNSDYFRTMGIPLRAGHIFNERDRNRKLAIVSALTAARLWPNQNAVGKRFRMGGDDSSPLIEVVGIVGDVRSINLNKGPSLTVYVPYWQRFYDEASLVAKTTMDPAVVSSEIRRAIRRTDPELPVPAFRTMEDVVSESVAERRFQMNLILLFAVSAMLLASLGIYGVVSYSVAQRTNEMGLRMALGAQPGDIRRMVLGQGLVPVVVGLGGGVIASFVLTRTLASLLFGVSTADPLTISCVSALMILIGAAATYLPARRATRVDPLTALHYE